MKTLLCCCLALLAVASALVDTSAVRGSFDAWRNTHRVQYQSEEEMEHRFQVFSDNLQFIEEWNSHPERHRVAINKFADLTAKEFKNHVMSRGSGVRNTPVSQSVGEVDIVDWRTKNAVGPVRQMGQNGDGVAIAVAESVEGCAAIASGHLITLSAMQIAQCAPNKMPQDAWAYVVKAGGLPAEAQTTACFGGKYVVNITGFKQVTSGSESALQAAVDITTPQVAIDASKPSFQFYERGVYYEPSCSSTSLDLAVLVVGYGYIDTNDFWIVKNSWGQDWGEGGYILMARNKDNNCGIATMAIYGTGCSDN